MSKRCTYCGWPNSDDAEYCKGCGYKLNKYWKYTERGSEFVDKTKNSFAHLHFTMLNGEIQQAFQFNHIFISSYGYF